MEYGIHVEIPADKRTLSHLHWYGPITQARHHNLSACRISFAQSSKLPMSSVMAIRVKETALAMC